MKLATILISALALVAVAIWQADIRTDIGDFFFAGDASESGFIAGQLQSAQMARQYLVGIRATSGTQPVDPDFVATLRAAIGRLPAVQRVWTPGLSDNDLRGLLSFYARHAIELYTLDPASAFADLATEQGLARQARLIKLALTGPDPQLVKLLLPDDPMLLSLNWASRLESLVGGDQESKGNTTSFFIETDTQGLDTAPHEAFQAALRTVFEDLNKAQSDAYTMDFTGVPVFATTIKQQVASDIHRVGTLSTLAVVLTFLVAFRSLRSLLLTSLLLCTTVAAALLVTQLVFGFVHGLTLALGITLIGVCIDYFIHGMVHMATETGAARRAAMRRIWPSLALGGMTTLVGYVAVSLSGFPGLQQIAVFSAAGILAALSLTRYVLPMLMDSLALTLEPRWQPDRLLTLLDRPRLKPAAYIVALGCLAVGLPQLHWSQDLGALAPAVEDLKQRDQALRAQLASFEPGRFILVEAATTEQALVSAIEVQRRLEVMKSEGQLQGFSPVFPWIAPLAIQRDNQIAWNALLDSGLQQRWLQALDAQGLAAAAFPQLSRATDAGISLDDLAGIPAWEFLSRQFIAGDAASTAAIWLGKHDPARVAASVADIPGARYFSQKDHVQTLANRYRDTAARLLLFGAAGIALLLLLRFRTWRDTARVLAPAALAVLTVIGAWSLSGTGLTFMHLIGLLLATAICVDYGIFFLENRGGSRRVTYRAILVSGVTTAASFGCLAAADNPALLALAGTVTPGVIMGFLLCPILLGDSTTPTQRT